MIDDDPFEPRDRRSGRDRRAHRDPDAVDVTRAEHWELEDAIAQFARRATWALRFVAVVVVGTAIAVAILADNNNDRVDDIEAQGDKLKHVTDELAQQADAIEQARRESILLTCRETNRRHDKSFAALDTLSQQAIAREPERAAEIRTSTEQFKVFVDALVPPRDCQKRVDQLTDVGDENAPGPPPPP